MNKNFRKIILPLTLLAASQSHALGLGGLQVNSALDEALDGKIPLVLDGTEDISNLKVSLASSSEYQKVGLDKSYVPSNILVNLVENEGQKYIEISSKGPVSEPIVSLLLVVDWANGHLLREYTLLLDPPIFNSSQVQQNYSEPAQTQTYQAPEQITSRQQSTAVNTISNVSGSSSDDQVRVEAGDTLWEIAERYNRSSATSQQMMVAIFNNNPSAFQNNDMNLIKKGAILDMPTAEQLALISNNEAVSEVRTQTQRWSRLQTSNDDSSSVSQSNRDYGIELVPPNDSESTDGNNSGGRKNTADSRTLARLNQVEEDLVSSNLENQELSNRIKELERIVADQKAALSLKDTSLAQLQQQLSDGSTAVVDDVWDNDVSTEKMVDDTMSTEKMVDDTMSTEKMVDDTMSTEKMVDDTMSTEKMVDDTMSTEKMVDDTMSTEKMVDDTMSTESMNSDTKTENVANNVAQTSEARRPQVQEKSLIDKILNYKYEALIGFGALLLAILGFIFFKRKDDSDEEGGFLDSITNDRKSQKEENQEELEKTVLDEDISELDLSNFEESSDDLLDEENTSEINEESDALALDTELNDEQPEVVVMDDQNDESDFDLSIDDFDLSDSDGAESLQEVEDQVEEDFDLDIDITDESDLEEKVETIQANASDETEMFELDMDNLLDESSLSEETNIEEVEENIDELTDVDSEEFTLDFDLDELDELELDADEAADDLDKDSAEQILENDISLDLSLEDDDSQLDNVVDDNDELEDLVFDTEELNIGDDLVSETIENVEDVVTEEPDLTFDLGDDFDLDLSVDDEVTDDMANDVEELEDVDIGLDFDDLVGDDAIDTKLDLARAYFEMGDLDGAKQMVIEIIDEGNADQQSKAQTLKDEIESS